MMAFCFNLFFKLLLSFHHKLSHFFHIQIGNFHLCSISPYLLYFIGEKDSQLRTIYVIITVLRIIMQIILINLLDELSLNYIIINARLTKLRVVFRLLVDAFRVVRLFLICMKDCASLGSSCSSSAKIIVLFCSYFSSLRIIMVIFLTSSFLRSTYSFICCIV